MLGANTPVDKTTAKNLSSVTLAFIGDAVYTLYIREKLSLSADYKAGVLSELTTSFVRASAQAQKIKTLMPFLTEEETEIFKRARNTHKPTKAKSASVQEYNASTGFEAVLGYLYITGESERLNALLEFGEKE